MNLLALELISENKRTQSPILDLGKTGLTELPGEIFDCTWLEELILSDVYYDEKEQRSFESDHRGESNKLYIISDEMGNLKI